MATLQSSIQLFDGFSKPLNNIISSVNMTINTLRTLNNTNVKINTKNLNEASKLIAIAQNDLTNIQNSINNNIDAQNRFNRSLGEGERKSENLLKSVGRMVAAYASFQTLKTGINLSDRLTQTTARLNLMNDGKQTTEELQQMIFQSAKNSRGSFLDLAQTVSKLGILVPNAFKSNAEAVAFTELMTKSFKIGGASGQEQSAGMYQLTQALASGRLQGDEFRSIMENAPMLAQAISNYVGVRMGDLRQLSSEGKLTAEIIKNAMFNASDTINRQFNAIPLTFADSMEVLKNNMINSFSVLSQKIVQIVNSEKFITVINTLSKSINVFIAIAAKALDLMSSIGSVIYDSWSILSPVIQGVSASVLTFVTVTGVVTKAIKIWTAAQAALNAVTMANPIILIISAVIGALYLGVAAFNKFAGTSVSATGIIVGAIYTSFTVVKNFVASIWNVLVGSMQLISNIVLSGVEFLMNALFGNPIKAIANLIVDCVQLVLDYIRMIAKMSDTVLGTNFTKNIDSWKSSLDGFREKFVGKNTIELGRTDFSSYMINNTKSPIQAFIDGHNAVKNLGSNEQNNTERLLGNIAINTKKVADSMDTSVEEIKYLRDVAEMEVINKFTTAEVKVDFGGITNQISNNADVDELIYNIGSKLTETLSSVANGRYN